MKHLFDSLVISLLAASCALFQGCGGNASPAEKGTEALEKGDFGKAAALLAEASSSADCTSAMKYNLGTALAMQGDHAGAIAAFEAALKLDSSNLDAAEYLASEYEAIGKLDEAHRLMDTVIAARGSDGDLLARALNRMAKIELLLDRPDLATVRLLTARDIAPGYAPTYYSLAVVFGNNYGLYQAGGTMAAKYLQVSAPEDSFRRNAETLIQFFSQHPAAPKTRADVPPAAADEPFQKGIAAYKKGRYSEAEQQFSKAEKKRPESYYASLFRAHSLLAAKKYKDAEAAYKKASGKATAEAEPVYWMGVTVRDAQNYSRALRIFSEQYIPEWPDDFRAYQISAEIYEKLGKNAEAGNRDSAPYFYSGLVFAQRCVALARKSGKQAPSAEQYLRTYSNIDAEKLTLSAIDNPIR